MDEYKDLPEDSINRLLYEALDRIAIMPNSLAVDKWRWDVFSGDVPQSKWNEHWWELVSTYQKLDKPSTRSEQDFDAGADFHVPAGRQHIRYVLNE